MNVRRSPRLIGTAAWRKPSPLTAAWVKRPNSAAFFAGRSALEVMLSGNVADLFLVRQYLDSERGGWS